MELTRKVTPTANATYLVAYAQIIVDHFSKALQENGCMIQVPAALYAEFDDQYNRLVDYLESANNAGSIDNDKRQTATVPIEDITGNREIDEAIRDAIRNASTKCFNCKIEKPKFDFSGILGNLTADIKTSLDQFKGMFKYNKASVCQYSFFLSYLCIPDLLKLISLILAAIVKLMQNIQLPRLTIQVFISGILSAIIEVLTKNISILARFALTPVLCILDAIDSIISQLPTPENIRAQNESDLRKLGVNEKFMSGKYDTGLAEKSKQIRQAYTSRVRNFEKTASMNTEKYVREIFGPLEETINKSVESLNNSIAELTGLLNHFTCEPSRSGISVSQYLSNLSEFMALVNLLRYIVRFKAGKAALDKLCNSPTDGGGFGNDNNTEDYGPMSLDNIGSMIGNIIESDVDIITDDKGNPVAIGIRDPESKSDNTDNLSFWSCNLNEFADSLTVPSLINYIRDLNLPKLNLDEFHQSPWKVTVVPQSEYNKPTVNTEIVPLVIDEVWNLPQHIKDIVSMIETYDAAKDPLKKAGDVDFLGENDINDIIKDIPYKGRGGNRLDDIPGANIRIVNQDGEVKIIDDNGNILKETADKPRRGNNSSIDNVDKLIYEFSNSINGIGQLDCPPEIQNILNKLGDF